MNSSNFIKKQFSADQSEWWAQDNISSNPGADLIRALGAGSNAESEKIYVNVYAWSYLPLIWEEVQKNITNPNLNNVSIVDLDYKPSSQQSDHYGVEFAYELLHKNPWSKVILHTCYPVWWNYSLIYGEEKTMFDWLQQHKNCRIVNVVDMYRNNYSGYNTLFDDAVIHDDVSKSNATKKLVAYSLHLINHQLSSVKDRNAPQTREEENRLKQAFEITQRYFPNIKTVEEMFSLVKDLNIEITEVMSWQRIEWVWCDLDWTLITSIDLDTGELVINAKVLDFPKKQESMGKKITLWTWWWEINEKQRLLQNAWITLPVVSKYDYAWATAEIMVDDLDEGILAYQYKLKSEKYINVNNIE